MDGTSTTSTSTTSTPAAPATSAPASVSTPASAPASSGTPESRPATFEAAFAASPMPEGDDPGTSDATTDAPTADPAVPAIAAPAVPPEAVTTTPKGPIPFDRHEAILKNTRSKVQEDTLRAVADEVRPLVQFREQFTKDKVGTLIQLWQEVEADPTDGPLLRSHAARVLRNGRQPAQAGLGAEAPAPDVQDQTTGETFYSPARAAELAAWQAQQAVQQAIAPLQSAIQPIQAEREQQKQADAHRQFVESQQTRARETVAALRQRPYFRENESAIKAAMVEQGCTVQEAYAQVVASLVPTFQEQARKAYLAEATAKTGASITQPGANSPARPTRPKTFEEAFANS